MILLCDTRKVKLNSHHFHVGTWSLDATQLRRGTSCDSSAACIALPTYKQTVYNTLLVHIDKRNTLKTSFTLFYQLSILGI